MNPRGKRIGLILIGDELLNGSRQDKHLAKVIELLKARGMALAWVRMATDEYDLLLHTLQETLDSNEIVFSFGGIGATPDDLTRQCAAAAFGVKLIRHPQAVAILEKRFGDAAYPNRIRMAELPDGSVLIPNPINQIPGFKIKHHHFVPGFPNMAWPMIEWVLDTYYRHLHHTAPQTDQRWMLHDIPESELIPMMETLLMTFPQVRLSSLPSTENRFQIDFGLKGTQSAVDEASLWLEPQLTTLGVQFERLTA